MIPLFSRLPLLKPCRHSQAPCGRGGGCKGPTGETLTEVAWWRLMNFGCDLVAILGWVKGKKPSCGWFLMDFDGFCCTSLFFALKILKVVSKYVFSELKWKLSMIPGAKSTVWPCSVPKIHVAKRLFRLFGPQISGRYLISDPKFLHFEDSEGSLMWVLKWFTTRSEMGSRWAQSVYSGWRPDHLRVVSMDMLCHPKWAMNKNPGWLG